VSGTISGGSDKKGLFEGAFASSKAYDIVKYDNWLVVQLLKRGGNLEAHHLIGHLGGHDSGDDRRKYLVGYCPGLWAV